MTLKIGAETFRLVATIDEGQTLFFKAGKRIAVEKFDMRPGGTEFDYQVTSRGVHDGKPEAVAGMAAGFDREFLENRTKSNPLGLPVNVGNAIAMARDRRIALTYGELRPQVFNSPIKTAQVGWRIWFNRAWYAGAGGRPSRTANGGANARVSARASARIGAMSVTPRAGLASGGIGALGNDAGILRVWVPVDDGYAPTGPFDRHDVVGRPPSITDRIGSMFRDWVR